MSDTLLLTFNKAESDAKKARDRVKYWCGEIDAALKREKDFRKEGDEVISLYEEGKADKSQFNILFSNTETLAPALYNSTPRPVVKRRFNDPDPIGAAAAKLSQRILEFMLDKGDMDYSPFDDCMKSAVLEALLPGRGVTEFKYDSVIGKKPAPSAEGADDVSDPADAPSKPAEEVEYLKAEAVCGEEVPWDRFLHGYAKKWSGVPWVAFETMLTVEEAVENYGEKARQLPKVEVDKPMSDDAPMASSDDAKVQLIQVWRIWSKRHRKVISICPQWPDDVLKEVDDPLELAGFFPCPKPLGFYAKVKTMTPRALYKAYQGQAEELNRVTLRLNRVLAALKVRGAYDQTIEGIDKIIEADDNTMTPVQNIAALDARGGTLEKAVWLWPIEKLVTVAQQLYLFRQQCKQVIYEITGIADIMRGASVASETLGAQEIKNQWGTLRLKRSQKEVMRYARDCLRLMLEIAVSKLDPGTIKKMTGTELPLEAEKAQAQQLVQAAAVRQAEMGPPMEGQEPPPPDPQVQAAEALLKMPSVEQVLELLKDDALRSYKVDIETNSTIDAEATEDKEDLAELTNAIAQFLAGIGPLVENGFLSPEVAQGMLLAIVRRFRLGPEFEEHLKNMKPPEPKPDPKVEAMKEKAKLDAQKAQQDMAARQQELEVKKQLAAIEVQMKQMELQMKQQELELKRQEMQLKAAAASQKAELDTQNMTREAEFAQHTHGLKMTQATEQFELKRQMAQQAARDKKAAAAETSTVKA